jgi:hypothetical protein
MRERRKPRPAPALRSSVESDHDSTPFMRPSIIKKFAEMASHVGCARRSALDLATQGLQFGHQVRQRPGGKDAVRLLERRVT